ncbi:hypothetical protein LUZ60_010839 [Juncus effusus]|nr:hypothetical protein LUZ60_010839 [Juncus effusus]
MAACMHVCIAFLCLFTSIILPFITSLNWNYSSSVMAAKARMHLFLSILIILSLACVTLSFASNQGCGCDTTCGDLFRGDEKERCVRLCKQICREGTADVETRREGQERNNPYYFGEERFVHGARTQHGHFKVLEKFSKRSRLLKGIENYRFATLEAEPKTFIMPSHWDADEVFYVVRGRGTIILLHKENREAYDIKEGDIMMVPSGVIVYLINKDDNERLRIALLLQPVSLPGNFEEFMTVGGRNPETFYSSFSDDLLEAAFNAPRDRLERVFGKQSKGEIFRASDEQIKALSKTKEGKGKSRKPFNILKKKPTYSNNYGSLYEVATNDFEQLKEMDVDVSIANISCGSMMAPNYNSRSTNIAIVIQGSGYIEMTCPHLSKDEGERGRRWEGEEEEEEEERGQERSSRYKLVRSRLHHGSVFVIPASHPVITVASRDENLQILCFGIKAENNWKYFLAGKNNVLNEMEKEAKELAFDTPAREVEQLLKAQKETVFFPGPGASQRASE